MKIKHSKYKNTGLIFELLVKQIAADTLSRKDSPAVKIMKKFYTGKTSLVREDSKRAFRIAQIENEGNDPAKSGVTYGTPHDLASMYGRRGFDTPKMPVGYEEPNPEGRPREAMSTYGTQDSPFGRDRLGTHDMHGGYNNEEDDVIRVTEDKNDNLTAKSVFYQNQDIFKTKKSLIFEKKEEQESKLLDESNIKDLGQ